MRSTLTTRSDASQSHPAVRSPHGHASAKPTAGMSAGMPLFLKPPAAPLTIQRVHMRPRQAHQQSDPYEHEAQRAAAAAQRDEAQPSAPLTQRTSGAAQPPIGAGEPGQPLPAAARARMEARLGTDLSAVRLHTDARANQLARSFGANALTQGNDIFFNAGRYDPASVAGQGLLAHELAHVVQQGGRAGPVQCDLMSTLPTSLGYFEIEMATRSAPRPGMQGNIRFFPDPSGPYSAQIGLIQVVNTTDVRGRSTPTAGAPVDWSQVGGGAESGRGALMTTGLNGAPPGWFIDSQTAAHGRDSDVGPNYIEQWGIAGANYFGWLRSPTDWGAASLYDYPWFSFDVGFEFETVAKATDTQAVYGALEWGFNIHSGAVTGEYAHAVDTESAVFNEALERFRGYYTHEPIVLYFDTNIDTPLAGEDAKITGVIDYLNRYPDVQIDIDGYADERGASGMNHDLSMRRAQSVEALAIGLGVDPARIQHVRGHGETPAFAPGADAGSWHANRRVVMTFVRTASTPIVMP